MERIKAVVVDHSIPSSLIVDSDEIDLKLVPQFEWIMEKEGPKKIAVKSLEKMREVTAFLSITPSGVYLPPQVLYQGTDFQIIAIFGIPVRLVY